MMTQRLCCEIKSHKVEDLLAISYVILSISLEFYGSTADIRYWKIYYAFDMKKK